MSDYYKKYLKYKNKYAILKNEIYSQYGGVGRGIKQVTPSVTPAITMTPNIMYNSQANSAPPSVVTGHVYEPPPIPPEERTSSKAAGTAPPLARTSSVPSGATVGPGQVDFSKLNPKPKLSASPPGKK